MNEGCMVFSGPTLFLTACCPSLTCHGDCDVCSGSASEVTGLTCVDTLVFFGSPGTVEGAIALHHPPNIGR